MIDATLLVRQFGIHVAPRIDGAAVKAVRSRDSRPLVCVSQGANQGANDEDGDMYGDETQEEHNDRFRDTWMGRNKGPMRLRSSSQGVNSRTSQSLGQGLDPSQVAEAVAQLEQGAVRSESTHLTQKPDPR